MKNECIKTQADMENLNNTFINNSSIVKELQSSRDYLISHEYISNYLSDKMFDATLMWSMPIYFGATNVADYLPPDSYHSLSKDLNDGDLEMVKDICSQPPSNKNIEAMKDLPQPRPQTHILKFLLNIPLKVIS